MYNYDKGIFIDLSSFDDKVYYGLKFKSSYFINAIKDIIDSLEEGVLCEKHNTPSSKGVLCNGQNCSSSKGVLCDGKRYDVYIFTNQEKDFHMSYVNNIYTDIKKTNSKLNVELNIVSYDIIYELSKKFKNVILSSNIITYLEVNRNMNDIEDQIVIGYHFGLIKPSQIKVIKNYDSLYIDNDKFYITNPLVRSEFISYTDLDYLL